MVAVPRRSFAVVAEPDMTAWVSSCSSATKRLAQLDLERSGLTLDNAEAAGMFPVDNANAVHPDMASAPGLIIPYYGSSGQPLIYEREGRRLLYCRVRYLTPSGFPLPRGRRYDQPDDSGTPPYFPLAWDWEAAMRGSIDASVVVEGEKKAVALCRAGIPAVGTGGVWNFGDGSSQLHPALATLAKQCRDIYIVFDSDAATNPKVRQAEWRLAGHFALIGVRVHIVRIPPDGANKVGADDYLVRCGRQALFDLVLATPALGAPDATTGDDSILISELLRREVKPVEELVPGWIEKGIPTFLAGPGGVHKSRLALQWGLCLNAGVHVWGGTAPLTLTSPRATLVYCAAEDDADELTRRATAICNTLKIIPPDTGIVIARRGKDSALAVMGESGKVDVRPFFHELVERLQSIPGHKVVVLDSAYDFVRFAGRAKIDEDSVNYFIKIVLQRVCDQGDCTLIIPWHPSQAGSERDSMDGWSVAWHNAPRARLALREDKHDPGTYELSVTKRNHGLKSAPIRLRFHQGALLPVDALPIEESRAALHRVCVALAKEAAEKARPFTGQKHIAKWALDKAEQATGRLVTSKQFKDELEAAVQAEELVYIKGSNKQAAGYYPPDAERAEALARRRQRTGDGDG